MDFFTWAMLYIDLEHRQYGQTMKLPFPEKLEALAHEAMQE